MPKHLYAAITVDRRSEPSDLLINDPRALTRKERDLFGVSRDELGEIDTEQHHRSDSSGSKL